MEKNISPTEHLVRRPVHHLLLQVQVQVQPHSQVLFPHQMLVWRLCTKSVVSTSAVGMIASSVAWIMNGLFIQFALALMTCKLHVQQWCQWCNFFVANSAKGARICAFGLDGIVVTFCFLSQIVCSCAANWGFNSQLA